MFDSSLLQVLLTSVVTGKFLIHCQYYFQNLCNYGNQHRMFLLKIAFDILTSTFRAEL
jgi:hypothetical protein